MTIKHSISKLETRKNLLMRINKTLQSWSREYAKIYLEYKIVTNLLLIFCSLIACEDRPKHSSTDTNKNKKAAKKNIALFIVNFISRTP